MIAEQYTEQGHPTKLVLEVVGISRSTYYDHLKPKHAGKKRGRNPSTHTLIKAGVAIPNEEVIEQIKDLLSQEFIDYGYLKVTHWLRQNHNYIINPKKVYRMMKENGLLNSRKPIRRSKRNWVKDLVPVTTHPFDYLEFDIKYEYVHGERRNALCLSVLDVNSRWLLGHITDWNIRQTQVMELFEQIFSSYSLPRRFYVRCDNGSQFIGEMIQKFFEKHGVNQEFCKPATPEQNGHIEAYHSIVEKLVCQSYEFESLEELRETKNRFVKFYNWERIHSGIDYLSPYKYLNDQSIHMDEVSLAKVLDCGSLVKEQKTRED